MLISSPEPESKTVLINTVETPCKIKYTSGPLGGCLWLDQDIPENSVVEVQKKSTLDTLRNVRKIGPGVYSCDITWGIFQPVGSPHHPAIDMSYTYYCLGLADQSADWKELQGNYAAAYAIGSLDRLAAVRLPRCRKEVEAAVAALSDPNYVTMSQQWQERCDRLQAERDEYHSQLDALRKEADGITELDREDILAARCRRAAAVLERTVSPTVVDGNAFMQVQKD